MTQEPDLITSLKSQLQVHEEQCRQIKIALAALMEKGGDNIHQSISLDPDASMKGTLTEAVWKVVLDHQKPITVKEIIRQLKLTTDFDNPLQPTIQNFLTTFVKNRKMIRVRRGFYKVLGEK